MPMARRGSPRIGHRRRGPSPGPGTAGPRGRVRQLRSTPAIPHEACMRRIWRDNGLTLVLVAMFLVSFVGQAMAGQRVHNEERLKHGEPALSFAGYIATPAFMEATAENWESEFLQMGVFVLLTSFLYQRGSAESKDPDRPAAVDREPDPRRPRAPLPVRR